MAGALPFHARKQDLSSGSNINHSNRQLRTDRKLSCLVYGPHLPYRMTQAVPCINNMTLKKWKDHLSEGQQS